MKKKSPALAVVRSSLFRQRYRFYIISTADLLIVPIRFGAAGYPKIQIAQAIHKSAATVRNPMSFILAKLQVCDRTRAVLKAIEHGLI